MLSKENISTNKNILTKNEKLIIILISIFSPLIHEIGHSIGFILDGLTPHLSFFRTSSSGENEIFWGFLGGILIQIILISLFLLVAFLRKHKKEFWLTMCIPMILARLIPYILFAITSLIFNRNVFMQNDEQNIANLFNIPLFIPYILCAIIFIVFWIILKLNLDKKYFYKLNFIVSTCIFLIGIIAIAN